jgi:hypothetical protein
MWIYLNRDGRLGNRLFSRAHTYAAAIEYGEIVLDWGAIDIKDYFPSMQEKVMPIFIPKGLNINEQQVKTSKFFSPTSLSVLKKILPRFTGSIGPLWSQCWGQGNTELMRLDQPQFKRKNAQYPHIILNGFKLRCPEWLIKNREEICSHFLPPSVITDKWSINIETWKRGFSCVIGVHIRLADFQMAAGGRNYVLPKEYIDILQRISDLDLSTALVIFFSDHPFYQNKLYSSSFRWHNLFTGFVNCGTEIDDIVIGPSSSTFSRWAAFAANKKWLGINREVVKNTNESLKLLNSPIPWGY